MALSNSIRHMGEVLGHGLRRRHWFDERGVPGWTRTEGGYPCLHWADMHIPVPYDEGHEVRLLKKEAEELEVALIEVRARIRELEDPVINPS